MSLFSYHKPKSIPEASAIAESYHFRVKYLAGGTDLLVHIKNGTVDPEAVIDLKSLDDLDQKIEIRGSNLHIGALASFSSIQNDPLCAQHFPALVEAAASVGTVQIRNRGTIGGNVCNASPAADTLPPLFVYEAEVTINGSKGQRTLPIRDFLLGPGKTILAEGEILSSLEIPLPTTAEGSGFSRMTRRWGADLAVINICCRVLASTNTVFFAVGAAAPVPFVVVDDSGLLLSPSASDKSKHTQIESLMTAASPIDDVRASKEYRQGMLVVLAERTLARAIERLGLQDKDRTR
jgi:CO/xanthine dehydrogenase FAD-binding subunit